MESSTNETRRKRQRYIGNACQTCKRRKVRCDGKEPCQQCSNRSDHCVYSSEHVGRSEYIGLGPQDNNDQVIKLTNLVKSLQQTVDKLTGLHKPTGLPSLEASPSPNDISGTDSQSTRVTDSQRKSANLSGIFGPSSSYFGFGIAKQLLQDQAPVDVSGDSGYKQMLQDDSVNQISSTRGDLDSLCQILCTIGEVRGMELFGVWQNFFGQMHDIVDVQALRELLRKVLRDATIVGKQAQIGPKMIILCLVLAITLLTEGDEEEKISMDLVKYARRSVHAIVFSRDVQIDHLVIFTLMAMFYFLRTEVRLASRTIAIAGRFLLEYGLNRQEVVKASWADDRDQKRILELLWSIFVLDSNFSFPAGLLTLLDLEMFDLPMPQSPYLRALISYVTFGKRTWKTLLDDQGRLARFDEEEVEDLEARLHVWQVRLPAALRTVPSQCSTYSTPEVLFDMSSSTSSFVRHLLDLRTNQLRIMIRRPLLFATDRVKAYPDEVVRLFDIVKDSLRLLDELNTFDPLYCRYQVLFNHFLSSVMSVLTLLLAYQSRISRSHESVSERLPSLALVTEQTGKGLRLIRAHTLTRSSSRRLWERSEPYREMLVRHGLLDRSYYPTDEMSTTHSVPADDTSETEQMATSMCSDSFFDLQWSFDELFPPITF